MKYERNLATNMGRDKLILRSNFSGINNEILSAEDSKHKYRRNYL